MEKDMKRLAPILLALLLGACATYRAEFSGEKVTITATSSPVAAEAKGTGLKAALWKDDTKLHEVGPLDGTIRWRKGEGFTVTRDAVP
jgi:hypothetical protein